MQREGASADRGASTHWHRLALGLWAAAIAVICVRVLLAARANTVYPIFASAGRGWLHGEALYPGPKGLDAFRYSPPVAALFAPFSLLPDALGGCLWRLLNAAVYLAAFAWWRRAVLPGGGGLGRGTVAALWLLLLPLSVGNLNNGQSNPLVTGLLLAAVAGAARERWNLAAACVTAAGLFKGYPLAVGLLLAAIYPRQFGLRLVLALIAGLALPFLLQRPDYVVRAYQDWLWVLGADDRTGIPADNSYRDLWQLFRLGGVPISRDLYFGLQLACAAGAAALCLGGRAAGWPRQRLLTALFALGTCWMLLCGPATESSTYHLLAPVLAWAVVEAWAADKAPATRYLTLLCFGLLTMTQAACWFPVGKQVHALGVQPLATLLLTGALVAEYITALAWGRSGGRDETFVATSGSLVATRSCGGHGAERWHESGAS
jgi:hypothetical protein